jgi:selenocysteine-specific elongation factor
VRNVQVHGHPREAALAGERAALQLTGIELPALERGQQLVTPGALAPATSLLGRFTLLAEAPVTLRGWTAVTLHLLAAEVPGRLRPLAGTIEPGATGPVELRLARPLAAVRGDRFVARRPSPAATLGGGEVLDPRWRRHRGTLLEHALAALNAGQREAIGWWLREAGEAGLDEAEIAQRLGRPRPEVAATLRLLARELGALAVEGGRGARRWISPGSFERVQRRAARVLQDYFRADRLATAMPKAEAVRRMFRGRAGELADVYLDWLAGLNVLAIAGDRVTLPGRTAELTGEESRLARAALSRFEAAGLQPPSPGEVRQELGAKREILDGVLRHLVKRGQLVQLPGGLIAAASAIGTLRDELAATGWERFSVPQFKDRFGLSRKWAIPLLEHLDSVGVTRRVGDERQLVR